MTQAMKGVQISKFKKEIGIEPLHAAITVMLEKFYSLTSTELSTDQILNYAAQLIKDFWMLRLEEIALVLRKGIKGEYGKVYGKISYMTLCDWLNGYLDSRTNHIDNQHNNQKVFGERDKSEPIKLTISDMEGIIKSNKENK